MESEHKEWKQAGPETADKLIGTTLAETYEVLSFVGQGGMGVVYKARHRLLDRIVAIKILHTDQMSSPDRLKRFRQEALAMSTLSHRHLVKIYACGEAPGRQPFLVMDYLEGSSLSEILKVETRISPRRCVNIFAQSADALAHTHEQGILHRDLKPGNIVLSKVDNEPDFVKIVDFGIAKFLPEFGGQAQNLTQTGAFVGSPLYMSPEQCLSQALDARSDIYSLGCVMYESLSGNPPVSADSPLSAMYDHLNKKADPFAPELKIPAELSAIVFKALEKEGERRYRSMSELKKALEGLDTSSIDYDSGKEKNEATPGKAKRRDNKGKGVSRSLSGKRMAILASALSLATLAGIGLSCLPAVKIQLIKLDIALKERQDNKTDIIADWLKIGRIYRQSCDFPKAEKAFISARELLSKTNEGDCQQSASIAEEMADMFADDMSPSKAWQAYQEAATILTKIVTARDARGDKETPLPLLQHILAIKLKANNNSKEDWTGISQTLVVIIAHFESKSQLEQAAQYARQWADLTEGHCPSTAFHTAALTSLGHIRLLQNRTAEGQAILKQSQEMAWRAKPTGMVHNDLFLSMALQELAACRLAEKQYADADKLFARAQEICQLHKDIIGERLADMINGRAQTATLAGRAADARKYFEEAAEAYRRVPEGPPPAAIDVLSALGNAYAGQKEYAKAEAAYAEATTLRMKLANSEAAQDGIQHTALAQLYAVQAAMYRDQRSLKKEDDFLRKAIGLLNNSQKDRPTLATSWHARGDICIWQGRPRDGLVFYQRARDIWESLGDMHQPIMGATYFQLAGLAEGEKQYAEAVPLYQQALVCWRVSLGPRNDRCLDLEKHLKMLEGTGKFSPQQAPCRKYRLGLRTTSQKKPGRG